MFSCFRLPAKKTKKSDMFEVNEPVRQMRDFPNAGGLTVAPTQRHPSQPPHVLELSGKERQHTHKEKKSMTTFTTSSYTSATTSTHSEARATTSASVKPSFALLNDRTRILARNDKLPKEIAACLDKRGFLRVPPYTGEDWDHMMPYDDSELAQSDAFLSFVELWTGTLNNVISTETAPALQNSVLTVPDLEPGDKLDAVQAVSQFVATHPLNLVAYEPQAATDTLPVMLGFVSQSLPRLVKAGLNTVYLDAGFSDALAIIERGIPDYVPPPAHVLSGSSAMTAQARKMIQQNKRAQLLRDLAGAGVRLVSICSASPMETARNFLDVDTKLFAQQSGMDKIAVAHYFDNMKVAHVKMENIEMLDKINQDFTTHPDARALALVDAVNFDEEENFLSNSLCAYFEVPTLHAAADYSSNLPIDRVLMTGCTTGDCSHLMLGAGTFDKPKQGMEARMLANLRVASGE